MAHGPPPTRIVTNTTKTSNEFFTFGLLAKVAKQILNSKNGKVGYLVVSFAVTRNKLIMLTDASRENHRIELNDASDLSRTGSLAFGVDLRYEAATNRIHR